MKIRKEYLSCQTGLIDNDRLYTVHTNLGLLMEYDLKNFAYRVLCKIDPRIDGYDILYVNSIIKKENVFYLLREKKKSIIEYNLDCDELNVYGDTKSDEGDSFLTSKGIIYDNNIWMFPFYTNQKITVFNTITKEIMERESLDFYLEKKNYDFNTNNFIRYLGINEDKVYFLICDTSCILIFDMKNEIVELYEVMKDYKIYNATQCENGFWCSFYNSTKIVEWHDGKIEDEYNIWNEEPQDGNAFWIFEKNSKKYSIHICESGIVINNVEDNLKSYEAKNLERTHPNQKRSMFLESFVHKDKVILLPFAVNNIVIYDMKNQQVSLVNGCLEKEDFIHWSDIENQLKKSVIEDSMFKLEDLINIIKKDNNPLI